jgi:1,4-dihydroxy-2-naphthoate octaprenyltransferase
MSFRVFFKLVEIQTKIASISPFITGALFVCYYYRSFNPVNTIIFFISMLMFDMTTTTINNYMDYRKATDKHDFDYRKERNIIGQAGLSEKTVVAIIITMLSIATGFGIWLVIRTDLLVLFIGVVCFCIGIFYTFGPIPLSRMPLGEVFSGVTMGVGITFLVVYASVWHLDIANIRWAGLIVEFRFNLAELGKILLIALPPVFTIANLMLANNICDVEEDVLNNRFTLPYYLGKKKSVVLFQVLYYMVYVVIVASVLIQILHPLMLAVLVSFIPVQKNIMIFRAEQSKAKTFSVSVKNLVWIHGSIIIFLALSLVFSRVL